MTKAAFNKTNLDLLAGFIRGHAIRDDAEELMLSSSGERLQWLIDMRPVFLDPDMLDIIATLFWDEYEARLPFQVAGMEVAAIPLITAILLKAKQRGLQTNGLIIRKERKTTGLGKNIEGEPTGAPVILVDDLLNSGNSLNKAKAALDHEGQYIQEAFVVIDYESPQGLHWSHKSQIPVTSLFKLSDFDLTLNASSWSPPEIRYKILWRHYEKGAFPFHVVPKSTPLVVGDHIYMGTESAKMLCIDRLSGEKIWEFAIPMTHKKGIWSSPAYHEGRLYFGAYNGNVYCLDAQSGKEIWTNPACEFVGSSPLIVPQHNLLAIGLEYQRPRAMGSNAAFDLETGTRLWETQQTQYQHGSAAYYAPKDLIIFGNADHNVSAYDAKSGKLVWKSETERSIKYPPAIDEERKIVVSTSFDGNIYVMNAESGERLAAIQTDEICYTTPLIANGKIFAGSGDRKFYIIDAQNYEVLDTIQCGARIYSSPRLIDGHVVFGTNGGTIFEIDPETHSIKGQAQLPDAVTNAVSASADNTTLYAASHMNELYAIERSKIETS